MNKISDHIFRQGWVKRNIYITGFGEIKTFDIGVGSNGEVWAAGGEISNSLVRNVYTYKNGVWRSCHTLGDVNCDNTVDILDALLIAQYYVGLITEFPCP